MSLRANLDILIEQLSSIGYVFDVNAAAEARDWALELRLTRAIGYAQSKKKRRDKDPLAVFKDPALQWVADEQIVLPKRFFPHPQVPGILRLDPDAASKIGAFEKRNGVRLPASLKAWFVECGSIDLSGVHPFLNPQHRHDALRIAPFETCANAYAEPWLPLWPANPDAWRVNLAEGSLADGRDFLAAMHEALWWGGLPGWAADPKPPERELAYIRLKMERV
jgi:hypothetical protein